MMNADDDAPDTEFAPTILAPPTQFAWSSEPLAYPRRSWPLSYVMGAVVGVGMALLAGALVFMGLMLRPAPTASAPSAAPTVLTQMQPAPSLPPPVTYTSTVPPSTVTVPAQPTRTGTPQSSPSRDDQYLAYLRARNMTIVNRVDAINAAQFVCSELGTGKSKAQIVAEAVPKNPQLTYANIVDVVDASALFYCPEYTDA